MTLKLSNEAEKQVNHCLNLLKDVLRQNLLGVYLYGSAILGGLQKYSDIDLFVVSDRSIYNSSLVCNVANFIKYRPFYPMII